MKLLRLTSGGTARPRTGGFSRLPGGIIQDSAYGAVWAEARKKASPRSVQVAARPPATVIFALGECLLAPTLPAIINDLAPPGAAGRYNGLGVLAFTTGLLLGPAAGGAALGAGRGTGLFAALVLGWHLPPAANQIPAPGPLGPAPAGSNDHAAARSGHDMPAGRSEMITA